MPDDGLCDADLGDVWNQLKARQLSDERVEQSEFSWLSLFCQLLQPASLSEELVLEKKSLVAVAQSPFDRSDEIHTYLLRVLYRKLAGTCCPSEYGPHWQSVGFQSQDPSTDFRGVGVFGLVQPFCLSLQDRPLSFLLKVIRLSQCPKQGFPFMVLSLNVTHIVLNSLRRGYLDRAFRKRGAVLPVTNLYYGAVLHFIYERWKCEDLTLVDSGSLLKKAESNCNEDVMQCIVKFENYLQQIDVSAEPYADIDLEQVQLDVDISADTGLI